MKHQINRYARGMEKKKKMKKKDETQKMLPVVGNAYQELNVFVCALIKGLGETSKSSRAHLFCASSFLTCGRFQLNNSTAGRFHIVHNLICKS